MPLYDQGDSHHSKTLKAIHRALCKARHGIQKALDNADDPDVCDFGEQADDALAKSCNYVRKMHGTKFKKSSPMEDDETIMKSFDDEDDGMMKGDDEDLLMDKNYGDDDDEMDKNYDDDEMDVVKSYDDEDAMVKGDMDMDGPASNISDDPIAKGIDYVDPDAVEEDEEEINQKSMLAKLRRQNMRFSRMLRGR